MPVLRLIRERFERERPLEGLRIGACLHVTTETANLMRTLKAGGAEIALCASNLLSTQDDVAAALVAEYGISVFARRGVGPRRLLSRTSTPSPTRIRTSRRTTAATWSRCSTGSAPTRSTASWPAPRRRRRASSACARWPRTGRSSTRSSAVNEAKTKHMFDNRFGTGQSTVDGILRATNILLAGRHVVVAGYGWVGQGHRLAHARHGRPGCDRGGRPDRRDRGLHGGLPGHVGPGGRRVGRGVHHRDRQPPRLPPRALRADAQRRDDGQQRPLRRRARPRRAPRDGRRATSASCAGTSRSTTSATARCTSSPRAGWSTWPLRRATRRP